MFKHCAASHFPMGFNLAYALLAAASSAAPMTGDVFAQLTIQQRVVIRVPMTPVAPAAMTESAPIRWKEAKGPKCLPLDRLAGAALAGPDIIDLIVRGGTPVRARLQNDCKQVDLRYGFYLRPTKDRQVCGGRDSVHARTGGQCIIERFRSLVPQR